MSFLTYGINTAWMWRSLPEWKAYQLATRCVEKTQQEILQRILTQNQVSQFGKAFQFSSIHSVEDYQRNVPIMSDGTYDEMLRRIAEGEPRVLTEEPILLLQPTSGTTRGQRLVPYTKSLRIEYQRAVAAWIGNLYSAQPKIRSGRAYWSISPAAHRDTFTSGGIRIGYDDDSAYLGLFERWLAQRILIAPSDLISEEDIKRFRYRTLLCLLTANDLALISIWSPTYLSSLLNDLRANASQLIADVRKGTLLGEANSRQYADPIRADAISKVLLDQTHTSLDYKLLWSRLVCISCWMDGSSQLSAQCLQESFPGVPFQAKGLMATEGTISFPIFGMNGCGLAIRSHFFEFQEVDSEEDHCRLAHELVVGRQYSILLTTGGGLYRYPLHDIIEVTGMLNHCPLLQFLGRANCTSDLVGEKLQETFVQQCLDRVLAICNISASFAMLVPQRNSNTKGQYEYSYALELEVASGSVDPQRLGAILDQELAKNIHYKYARDLSQLSATTVKILPGPIGSAWAAFETQQLERGQTLGSIKPTSLLISHLSAS